MPNSKQIVYLSQAQYAELIANGTITVNGVTVTYDENDIYVTPQAEPVTDVRVAGTSVSSNGVANVPIGNGLYLNNGALDVSPANSTQIKQSIITNRPIAPYAQNASTFYGLAKAAGHDEKDSTEPLGTYTPEAKGAIQKMLGITDIIATEENNLTASKAYAIGDIFTANGKLYKATAAIAQDAAIILPDGVGANCEEVTVSDGFVKFTDIATNSDLGIVRGRSERGVTVVNGWLQVVPASAEEMKTGQGGYRPLTGDRQHTATFYGLAKAAGDATQSASDNEVGTYTPEAKTAIQTMLDVPSKADIPEVPVQDVQVNGVSVLQDGVANVPKASDSAFGVIKVGTGLRIVTTDNTLRPNTATVAQAKTGTASYYPITPLVQDASTFYGLAKAAGADEKDSTLPVGQYTDTAKAAIRSMIGATSSNVIAVQDTQPTDADTKVWLPETAETPVQIPTMEDLGNYVQKTDIATSTTPGLVRFATNAAYGIWYKNAPENDVLRIACAGEYEMKVGSSAYMPIVPAGQHKSIFYGLSKLAGVDLANETVTLGTYPETSKTAIRSLIGAGEPLDVQVNGTSVVSNGVANIPVAQANVLGAVKAPGTYGVSVFGGGSAGTLALNPASADQIKAGNSTYNPISPVNVAPTAFYGFAKAAGDTTQSVSSNAVGTYTDDAKLAIQTMLGIDLSSIASEVEIPLVETVEGAAVTINGQPNTRYMCGEVTSISITPPSVGSIDVIFTSGTSVAVLTLPSTVKMPAWFDATALETDTIYEILITDGTYGSVMTWAV